MSQKKRLSWSAISTLSKCGVQYCNRYVLGIRRNRFLKRG